MNLEKNSRGARTPIRSYDLHSITRCGRGHRRACKPYTRSNILGVVHCDCDVRSRSCSLQVGES